MINKQKVRDKLQKARKDNKVDLSRLTKQDIEELHEQMLLDWLKNQLQ